MTKRKITNQGMRPRVYPILERAVEEGINSGWYRGHKYTETPEIDKLKEDLVQGVMGAICEVFKFDDDDEEGSEVNQELLDLAHEVLTRATVEMPKELVEMAKAAIRKAGP